MTLAVIETGGKQYVVRPDQVLVVEKLPVEEGKALTFDRVLLVADGKSVRVGRPHLAGSSVTATCTAQTKTKKVTAAKFHNKTRYRRFFGHRQEITKVRIEKISS